VRFLRILGDRRGRSSVACCNRDARGEWRVGFMVSHLLEKSSSHLLERHSSEMVGERRVFFK
jgi:hypothetical protein